MLTCTVGGEERLRVTVAAGKIVVLSAASTAFIGELGETLLEAARAQQLEIERAGRTKAEQPEPPKRRGKRKAARK